MLEPHPPSVDADSLRNAERLVHFAFEALEAGRWAEVPKVIHPLALSRFRSHQIENARSMERYRSEPRRLDPDMPAEVAEWYEERRRRSEAEYGNPLSHEFAGVESVADLEHLSAEEMLARWLEAHDGYEAALRRMRAKGDLPTPPPDRTLVPLQVREVIGAVAEAPDTVQVVYRTRIRAPGDDPATDGLVRTAVATVRSINDGRWGLWSTWQDHELFDGFSMGFELTTHEEILAKLEASEGEPFRWPAEGPARVTARIVGYLGGGRRPKALSLGVSQDGGAETRVEIPMDALLPLSRYAEPWAHLQPASSETSDGTESA